MSKMTVGGADIDIEFIEDMLSHEWKAECTFNGERFSTYLFKSQYYAMKSLEKLVDTYQKNQAKRERDQARLGAWNEGQPKRF